MAISHFIRFVKIRNATESALDSFDVAYASMLRSDEFLTFSN